MVRGGVVASGLLLVAVLLTAAAAAPPQARAHVGAPYRTVGMTPNFEALLRASTGGGDGFYVDSVQLPESDLFTDNTAPKQKVRKGLFRARMAGNAIPKLRATGTLALGAAALYVGWKIGRTIDTKFYSFSCAIAQCGDTTAPAVAPVALCGVSWSWQTNPIDGSGPYWLATICAGGNVGQNLIPCTTLEASGSCSEGWRVTAYNKLLALPGTLQTEPSTLRKYKIITEAEMEAAMDPTAFHTYTAADDPNITNTTTGHNVTDRAATINETAAANELDATDHDAEEWINFRLDPSEPDPFTFVMPQCVGSLVALCIAELDSEGHTGTRVITVADFNGADTSKPATAVLTQSVPAFTTIPYTTTITIHRNPDAADMPYLMPEPAPGPAGETFEAFVTRLGLLGFIGSASSTVLSPELADPARGPDDAVSTTPATGTRMHPSDPVTVRINPPDWPEPGAGGGGGCDCPSTPVDFSPITGIDYGSAFPFGVFVWAADILGAFNVSPDAPSWSFDLSDGAVGIDGASFDLDLQVFDEYMGWIRTLISWVLWVGAVWWFATRLLGFKQASDPSEAADEADII